MQKQQNSPSYNNISFFEYVIIPQGEIIRHSYPLAILKKARFVIYCDGATNHYQTYQRKPDLIIGDLDSIHPKLKEKFTSRLCHQASQDNTDLSKALDWILKHSTQKQKINCAIIGGSGHRMDHSLGNLGVLNKYNNYINLHLFNNHERITSIARPTKFASFPGQQVSFIAPDPKTRLEAKRLKFPVQNLLLKNWTVGTLNEATHSTFAVRPSNNLFVLQSYRSILSD